MGIHEPSTCTMKTTTLLTTLVVLALSLHSVTPAAALYDDLLMPALAGKGRPVAFIMGQGAGIAPSAYKPLLAALQEASSESIWAAVPQSPANTPQPVTLKSDMERSLKNLRAAGMPEDAALIFGGHSLGGAMSQD